MAKLNQNRLHIIAIASLLSGFLIWSITPYLTTNNYSLINKISRYSSLICSLTLSGIALHCGLTLNQKDEIKEATNKSKADLKYHELATTQYLQQKQLELLVSYQLQEYKNQLDNSYLNYQLATDEPHLNQGLTENPNQVREVQKQLVETELNNLVINAMNEGLSDSKIIKDILGYKGQNYSQGKELLMNIKQQIKE